MVSGGLLQLVAYGAQDNYLTGDPQITFFNVIYRKQTNTLNNKEHIDVLKSQIKRNDINSMYNLAEYYLSIHNYIKMLKYYIMYVKNISKRKKDIEELEDVCLDILDDNTSNKLQDIIDMCKTKRNIKELGELGDVCLDILDIENTTDECPICLDGCGKYKTECCKQFTHYNCLHSCKSCPFCRARIF